MICVRCKSYSFGMGLCRTCRKVDVENYLAAAAIRAIHVNEEPLRCPYGLQYGIFRYL